MRRPGGTSSGLRHPVTTTVSASKIPLRPARQNAHAPGRIQGTLFQAADLEGVPRIKFWTRQSKQFHNDTEFKSGKALIHEGCNAMRGRGETRFRYFVPWHDIYDKWHSGHWQEIRLSSILKRKYEPKENLLMPITEAATQAHVPRVKPPWRVADSKACNAVRDGSRI
jgi:hypothetical protein